MPEIDDRRNIVTGREIPSENYCDQPYVILNDDGSWTCTMTTGRGTEGEHGQHVVSVRTEDQGRTWSEPVDIEPADGPEASWVTPLRTPSGRIYVFYVYNRDNMREVLADDPPMKGGVWKRVDSFGVYAYRFSDDGGRSWSEGRWEIPVRAFEIDRENPYSGEVRFFWGVGKPFVHEGVVYLFSSKIGRFGEGAFARSEGMLLKSENLLAEADPARHRWETLPDGDVGLRAPLGPVGEEHNGTFLADGTIYCTFRTTQGYSAHAISRDSGHTWTEPAFMTYAPGSRPVKNPRAANFVRRFSNGNYLYWYHNHGGPFLRGQGGGVPYDSRNPAWMCGGVERDGTIHWSQPEIVLYDDDPGVRISYPDLLEEDGRYFVTATQKTVARVHELDRDLVEAMWRQGTDREVARDGLALETGPTDAAPMPALPRLTDRAGFAVEAWLRLDDLAPHQAILDARGAEGRGVLLTTADRETVKLTLRGRVNSRPGATFSGGETESSWDCDPGLLRAGAWHHVVAIVDGGPKVISFLIDGVLCDGGEARQFGWGRFNPWLGDVSGARTARVAPGLHGELAVLRVYDRRLTTSEAVANRHAGRPKE